MAVFWVLSLPALVAALLVVHSAISLARNYLVARRIGVPIRVIPIDHANPLWLAIDRKVVNYVRKLPGFLGNNTFTRYNYRTWEMHDRLGPQREMGEAFVIVTPARIWFYRTSMLPLFLTPFMSPH
jgi:hypothetical protein